MSSFTIPTWDPVQVARVGWDREQNTYWFIVYKRGPFGTADVDDPEISFMGGIDEPWRLITNVGDLLLLTWGEIKWESSDGIYAARALRDDPIFEAIYNDDVYPPQSIDDFAVHAFDVRAILAAEVALGTDPDEVPKAPAAVRNEPARAVPASSARVPRERRRFLRRRGA